MNQTFKIIREPVVRLAHAENFTPLSRYFTLEEMVSSCVAVRKHIDNKPSEEHLQNLRETCICADRVREYLGGPMIVSSGYRSLKLNAAVGGSKTSAHTRGEAIDFTCPSFGTAKEVFDVLRTSAIAFDQLILEFPDSGAPWVHIGFGQEMRRQALVYDGTQYRVA